ncbi:tryptophan 7-halogenase, partial [Thermanaerothrix sp.]|uniref:tryptophan 7-halogenase n=1 Tax=Thermanaerothrix sp. TaxID=2972675 RepID=UPI003A1032C0
MKKIVILGAGTAGTIVANRFKRILDFNQWQVTLIDPDPVHYYQPGFLFIPFRMYSEKDVIKPKRDFIDPPLRLIQSKVEAIDAEHNRVHLADGTVLPYDF